MPVERAARNCQIAHSCGKVAIQLKPIYTAGSDNFTVVRLNFTTVGTHMKRSFGKSEKRVIFFKK